MIFIRQNNGGGLMKSLLTTVLDVTIMVTAERIKSDMKRHYTS